MNSRLKIDLIIIKNNNSGLCYLLNATIYLMTHLLMEKGGGTMKFESMTDNAIAEEIGSRIEQIRLEQNLTQQQMADEVGLSRPGYRNLINGAGKFQNIIAVLRVLGRLDLVENFVPETTFSPIQQLKLKGKQRRRASKGRAKKTDSISPEKSDSELDW